MAEEANFPFGDFSDFSVDEETPKVKDENFYQSIINEKRRKRQENIAVEENGEETFIDVPAQSTQAIDSDPECKHWKRTQGHCIFQEKCKFRHISLHLKETKKTSSSDIIRDSETGKRKRKRPRNKGRAGEFRRWLINHFGIEKMKEGSGILDVAGGKGEISFELMNLNHCQSTIIDPRDFIDYSRFERKLLRGFYHRNDAVNIQFNQIQTVPPTSEEVRLPDHVKLFWGPVLWESLALGVENPCQLADYDVEYTTFYKNRAERGDMDKEEMVQNLFKKAREFTWTDKGLKAPGPVEDEEMKAVISYKEWDYDGLKSLLENCSCVVGMHPDQAAEGIVDFALRMNKPFALVPCCVYSKQFPKKKTPEGNPVTNYKDLISHLCAKHPDIRTETMPFEGKNTIVYWSPK